MENGHPHIDAKVLTFQESQGGKQMGLKNSGYLCVVGSSNSQGTIQVRVTCAFGMRDMLCRVGVREGVLQFLPTAHRSSSACGAYLLSQSCTGLLENQAGYWRSMQWLVGKPRHCRKIFEW